MSEPETRLNRLAAVELPREPAESPPVGGMPESRPSDDDRRSTRIAIAVIAAFWSLQWLYFTIDNVARAPRFEGWPEVAARAIVSFFGALISFGILKILQRCIGMSFVKRTLLALALAYGGAAIHSLINWTVFLLIIGPYQGHGPVGDLVRRRLPVARLPVLLGLSRDHGAAPVADLWRGTGSTRAADRAADRGGGPGAAERPSLPVEPALPVQFAELRGEPRFGQAQRGQESFLERQAMSAVERKLALSGFVRIHRSAIVSRDRIEGLERTRWGSLQVRLRDGTELRVSKSFEPAVRALV